MRSSLASTKSAGKGGELVNAPRMQIVPPGRQAATAVASVSAVPPTVSITRSIGASASPRRPPRSSSPITRSAPSADDDLAGAAGARRDHRHEPDRTGAEYRDALADLEPGEPHAVHGHTER